MTASSSPPSASSTKNTAAVTTANNKSKQQHPTPTPTVSYTDLAPAELEQKIVQLGRKGQTDQALQIYSEVANDYPHNVRLLNAAVDACARARPTRLPQAQQLLVSSPATPNIYTFGALMNACNRAGNWMEAVKLLKSMQQAYNVTPNAIVYSSAIAACARASKTKNGKSTNPNTSKSKDMALSLLKEAVEDKQLAMSVVGFNAAISACAHVGDYQNAMQLLERMKEATMREKNSNSNKSPRFVVPEPDAVTYGTVLCACERAHQWKMVLSIAQEMSVEQLDGLAIMSCLHACAELGHAQQALQYLERLKKLSPRKQKTNRERPPLSSPDAVAYHVAIAACARGGEWKQGIRLLEESTQVLGNDAANVVAYTAAITGCEYAGEWKHAFLLLDKMRKASVTPNELTMGAVIGACATAVAKQLNGDNNDGDYEFYNSKTDDANQGDDDDDLPVPYQKGMQLLSILKKDASVVNPNIQIYNAGIRLCAEARQIDAAFDLMDEILDDDSDLEPTEITYGSLMTACERVGDVEGASKVFRMMKEQSNGSDDGEDESSPSKHTVKPNEIIYGAAISCCRKAKEPERAFLLLKRMIQEGLSPNAACLNTVLIAQTEHAATKKSSKRRLQDSETVLTVFKLMQSPKYIDASGRPNRQTYNILVNYFCATDQPATAEAFLVKMQADGGFKPDVDLFTSTVSAYERTQQPLKAVQLMQRMQEEGFDFYSVKVLNSAFGKAVKLWNAVGQNFDSSKEMVEAEKRSLEQAIEDYNDIQGGGISSGSSNVADVEEDGGVI